MGNIATSPKPSAPPLQYPQYLAISSELPHAYIYYKLGDKIMPFKGLGKPAGVTHPRSIGQYQLNGQNG